MGKGSMGETGATADRRVLREALEAHRPELIQRLDSSTLFLTYLAKHRLIEGNDILRYEVSDRVYHPPTLMAKRRLKVGKSLTHISAVMRISSIYSL